MLTLHDAAHGHVRPASHGLRFWLSRSFNCLHTWSERARSRRELARLDDHMLGDIGLNRAMVEREFRKPFWRA